MTHLKIQPSVSETVPVKQWDRRLDTANALDLTVSPPAVLRCIRLAESKDRILASCACIAIVTCTFFLLLTDGSLGAIPFFMPIYQTVAIVAWFVMAYLTYESFRASGQTGLLLVSAGFLYTANMLVLQFMSFPGAFIKGHQLFGGAQSTIWLWVLSHLGPAVSGCAYALVEAASPGDQVSDKRRATRIAFCMQAALTVISALALSTYEPQLPRLEVNGNINGINTYGVAPACEVILAAGLLLLWRATKHGTVFYLWLATLLTAQFCDTALTMESGTRLTVGWYGGRLISLLTWIGLIFFYLRELASENRRTRNAAENLAHANIVLEQDNDRRRQHEEKLEQEDRLKNEFITILAHELRGPLSPIGSAAVLLRSGNVDPAKVARTCEIISRQVQHLSALVDDLLDVSRVTQGAAVLNRGRLNVQAVIDTATEQTVELMALRRHRFIMNTPLEPVIINADFKRLVQIVSNLLTNAAKYTPAGGEINLLVERRQEQLIISVKDNGVGVSPELAARVFEKFTQAERTSDRATGGLGLGLFLVKNFVELHGGEVACSSEGLGHGCTMTVRLPI